jgi:putative membrane protein
MIAAILVLVVAALHACFLVLEMFLWESRRGRKAFGTTETFARETRALAANQGLYNGFLAVGLVYGLWADPQLTAFMLVCVVVAGLYGAATATVKALYFQTIPAALALAALWSGI